MSVFALMKKMKCARIVVVCFLLMIFAGCGHVGEYFSFWQRQRELKSAFQDNPRAELLKQLEPENCYLLVGRITFSSKYQGPILIVAMTDMFKKREIVATRIMQSPVDHYEAYLPEGRYDLYFFADINGNGYFDDDELVARTQNSVIVDESSVKDNLTVNGSEFVLDLSRPTKAELALQIKVKEEPSVYETLDDAFFDPQYGSMGLYNPKDFTAHTQRYIFSLEAFNPKKTIIIFVHGVGGTPRDFKYLVDGLDRNRYQPFFFFYPSGLPLQKLGAYLADIVRHANNTYPLERVVVVAHSMGGLVSLSALNELCRNGAPRYLKGYISFNSPYGGVDSASKGVKYAPAVVPAWRDVATGSPFLERLYKGNALENVPFYLFFGYQSEESSDGTITLLSQLEGRVHLAAHNSYGFNATHEGILNNEKVRQVFNGVLLNMGKGR